MGWDCEVGPNSRTLGQETSVGHWSETLEWDRQVCFLISYNTMSFLYQNYKKFRHAFKIGWSSEAVVCRCSTK